MNYIEQINRFNRFTERVTRLSSGAQLLWYKLMDQANQAFWPDWVQVGTRTLMELMSIESEKTFHKLRKELLDNGLIDVERGKRGKLPRYHLYQFDEHLNLLDVNFTGNNYVEKELEVNFTPSMGCSKGSNHYPNRYPNKGCNNTDSEVTSLENYIYINKNKNKDKNNIDSTNVESLSSKEDEQKRNRIDAQSYKDFWNQNCGAMPEITCVRGKRLTALKARIKEFSEHDVRVAIQKAGKSSFLNGNNNRNWMASFDWILKPNNFVKVLEGNYDNKKTSDKKEKNSDNPRNMPISSDRLNAVADYENELMNSIRNLELKE